METEAMSSGRGESIAWDAIWNSYCEARRSPDPAVRERAMQELAAWHNKRGTLVPPWLALEMIGERAVTASLDAEAKDQPAGAVLSVARVRARAGLPKGVFDRAALELASRGEVELVPCVGTNATEALLVFDPAAPVLHGGAKYAGIAKPIKKNGEPTWNEVTRLNMKRPTKAEEG